MTFSEIDASEAAVLFKELGEPATYNYLAGGSVPEIYVLIDLDMEQFGDTASGVAEYRNEISLLRADIDSPQRGDTIITADETTYTVQDRVPGGSDKVEIKVSVK